MTREKTLGQIATEARKAYEDGYSERGAYDPDWKLKCDQHVASAIRAEVIEECIAKLKDVRDNQEPEGGRDDDWHADFGEAIDALRSLKEQPE
jgi:hypothetical protein